MRGSCSTSAWVPLPWWTSQYDQDAPAPPLLQRSARGHHYVVDETESHRLAGQRVVPWRPHRCQCPLARPPPPPSAARAATTTLLMKQNPIASPASAWCPGGRTGANAGWPASASRAAALAAPAAE